MFGAKAPAKSLARESAEEKHIEFAILRFLTQRVPLGAGFDPGSWFFEMGVFLLCLDPATYSLPMYLGPSNSQVLRPPSTSRTGDLGSAFFCSF